MSPEATIVLDVENQTITSDSSSREIIPGLWDSEYSAFINENAHVLVESPRMPGVELPLGVVVSMCPKPPTPENVHLYLAEAQQLVASSKVKQTAKVEEVVEEEKPKEAVSAETEEDGQQSNAKTEAVADPVQSKPNQATQDEDRAMTAPSDSRVFGDTTSGSSAVMYETLATASSNYGGSAPESTGNTNNLAAKTATVSAPSTSSVSPRLGGAVPSSAPEVGGGEASGGFTSVAPSAEAQLDDTKSAIKSEVEAKQQTTTFEISEADVAVNPIFEDEPAPYNPQLIADQETNSLTLPAANTASTEPEFKEQAPLNLEIAAILGDTIDLNGEIIQGADAGEIIEGIDDEAVLGAPDYQMDADVITDFVEAEEVPLDHIKEVGLEPDELYETSDIPTLEIANYNLEAGEEALTSQFDNESRLLEQAGITSPEQLVQISVSVEEVEDTLAQMTERIKASEPETTEKINQILDEIIEVPAKLKTDDGENIISEAQAQEKVEELFTELLDELGIDYTPEMIESLARLTLKWHLAAEIENLKAEEETGHAPQDIGTHEIIRKLLVGINNIKKAMAHAYAIGKSALQLYSLSFAT